MIIPLSFRKILASLTILDIKCITKMIFSSTACSISTSFLGFPIEFLHQSSLFRVIKEQLDQ